MEPKWSPKWTLNRNGFEASSGGDPETQKWEPKGSPKGAQMEPKGKGKGSPKRSKNSDGKRCRKLSRALDQGIQKGDQREPKWSPK